MTELRLYLRRDSLREDKECVWVLRHPDGHTIASGKDLENLPKAGHYRLVLAADLVTLMPASLPDLPARRLRPLLAAAAEAYSLSEAEQLQVAWLGRDEQSRSWLACIDKTWLNRSLAALNERGVRVDAALPETLLLPVTEGGWSVLWQENGGFVRFGHGSGAVLDRDEPPAALYLALSAKIQPAGQLPKLIRVFRGNAMQAVDTTQWQATLGVPVLTAGPWSWREAAWPEGLDLLQGSEHSRRGRIDVRGLFKSLLWGLPLLAGIQFAGAAVDWGLLNQEQHRLQSEMRVMAERALPAHAAVVDPAWQVGERLRTLRAAQGEGSQGFLSQLDRIGSGWPAGGAPTLRAVEYRDGATSLHLSLADEASAQPWLQSLESALTGKGMQVHLNRQPGNVLVLTVRENSASTSTEAPDGRKPAP